LEFEFCSSDILHVHVGRTQVVCICRI